MLIIHGDVVYILLPDQTGINQYAPTLGVHTSPLEHNSHLCSYIINHPYIQIVSYFSPILLAWFITSIMYWLSVYIPLSAAIRSFTSNLTAGQYVLERVISTSCSSLCFLKPLLVRVEINLLISCLANNMSFDKYSMGTVCEIMTL